MFTGIIAAQGDITALQTGPEGLVLWVDLNGLDIESIHVGDSIAVNGVCLTVTQLHDGIGRFDVSDETLGKSLMRNWKVGNRVNLETALTLEKPLGGHLISGHVDGTGAIDAVIPDDKTTWMQIRVSNVLGRFLAIKGSVAVDGVSLTTNHVMDQGEDTLFELTLVPHTLSETTLATLVPGDRVHIEVDILARYLDRLFASAPRSLETDQ